MKSSLSTLCYIRKNDQYLMLHRISKKDDVNRDKWIGVGGHFEDGESPEECMLREVKEETGLTLTKWKFHGVVTFVLRGGGTPGSGGKNASSGNSTDICEYMFLYTATEAAEGLDAPLPSCDEGVLEWVDISRITNLPLWEGDRIFLRLLAEDAQGFLLKLVYDWDGNLTEARLDGRPMLF